MDGQQEFATVNFDEILEGNGLLEAGCFNLL